MKILSIYFKNINSLEGENRIDFEESPFSDTGVFAITGPNGSGKSSILDAITLGLYGETFRFGRPAKHVMTQRSTECFSEIVFALGQDKYRSSWHAHRDGDSPESEPQPAEMKLIYLNGSEKLLAESQAQVCARITEITGMNFRNFTRSIMLAQGDFAAFLNALDSERLDILETILGSDIYADYKKEITERSREAQIELARREQELALIPVMASEKLEAAEHDLADFNDQYEALQIEFNELRRQQFALDKISALQHRITGQEQEFREIQAQATEAGEKLARIEASQDALAYREDLAALVHQNQLIEQSQLDLASYQRELGQLEEVFTNSGIEKKSAEGLDKKTIAEQQQAIGEVRYQISRIDSDRYSANQSLQYLINQINEKKSELATVTAWLEAHQRDETLLANFPETAKLTQLRAELVALRKKQKDVAQFVKNTRASIAKQKTSVEKEQAKLIRSEGQLDAEEKSLAALAQGKQLEEIEELRQEQQERVQSFKKLTRLANDYRRLTGGKPVFFGLLKRQRNSVQEAEELAEELRQLWETIKSEDNIRQILDASLAQEAVLRKMIPDRHLLIDGKPCPLCGALQHPYAVKPPAVGNSQRALADQQAKLKMLRGNAEKLEQRLKGAQKQAQISQANQMQAQQISAQWSALCNRLNILTHELNISNVKLMERLLASEEKELKDIVFLSAKYRSKQAGIEKLKTSITASKILIEQLQSSFQKQDSEWRERPDEKSAIENRLAQCLQEEKSLTEKVNGQLTLLGEKMPAKGKETAFFDRLNNRRRDYLGYDIRRKELVDELAALSAKELSCRTELTKYNDRIEQSKQLLKSEEIAGLHLALIETQKMIASQQQLIARQKSEAGGLQKALQEKLQGTPLGGIEKLNSALELIDMEPQLIQQKQQLAEAIALLTEELEKNRLELDMEQQSANTESSPEEINLQLKNVSEKLEISHLEIRHLETMLQDQQRYRQQYSKLSAQFQEQQEFAGQCQFEEAQLTDGGGMEFRRRVQQRIAEKLLSQTNAILEKISGRYYIRQAFSEQGLALEIEDTFQGNTRRLPKTLSGGESFVVSLALALGLSEMANNGKSVDSLFLDEGFGNLDPETLYTVITTLENLRTHGKTVGVISHVESVQKRFKAQLQVVKKPNGMGMLKKAS